MRSGMIARGGTPFVLFPAILIGLLLATALAISSNVPVLLTIPVGVLFIVFLVFFRDPAREIGHGIVSPADGLVVAVDAATKSLAIYMGILDVHVNRAPWSGLVVRRRRRQGGHSVASSSSASGNECVEWQLGTLVGQITLKQIAGMFARRIVPYLEEGARIKKGQRIGLIRFGSRVEVTLPPTARIVVKAGERVRAGETTIAEVEHGAGKEGRVR